MADGKPSAAQVAGECPAYAVLLSGGLRGQFGLGTAFANFEAALVLPNGPADVFAHVYHEPSSRSDALALQRLRAAPWLVDMHVEVFNASTGQSLIDHFGVDRYTAACKSLGRAGSDFNQHFVMSVLSKWRKVHLANQLRKVHEGRRGLVYRGVVHSRPALAYGARVTLDRLIFSDGAGALREEVLYLPLPLLCMGATWKMCDTPDPATRSLSCGRRLSGDACVDSPLLHDARTAAFADCSCCHGRGLHLNMTSGRAAQWPGRHIGEQLVLGSGPAIDVFSSMHKESPRLFDEEVRMFAGRFAPERSIARRVRNEMPWRFPNLDQVTMFSASWARDRVPISVRFVDRIQWGAHKHAGCSSKEW